MNAFKQFADKVDNLFVEHEKVTEIYEHLDALPTQQRSRHSFILGGGGVGKSQMAKNYLKKYPGHTIVDDEGTEVDIRPVVYLETPHPFTWKELYYAILKSLGVSRIAGNVGDLKERVLYLLRRQQVKKIIFDEIHSVLTSTAVSNRAVMEHLKHISNETNVSLILIGTSAAKQLRDLDDQYKTRFRVKYLRRFEECDHSFCHFLKLIEDQLSLPFPLGLANMDTGFPELLHYQSKGKVGFLIPIIQEAFRQKGIHNEDFNDFEKAKISISDLDRAYRIVVGDEETEESFEEDEIFIKTI
ncbi:TniB family NTP-binding protein [Mesobacillus selenatarsenatis]|uniref:AAA family ATPase n=1 Tax=Mesobacillus selenatarsenatis TaxID=388741 RepID=A0A846T6Y1_9BACI|nr:TniB family NTP-binding protein [Mesobacillus selenatarsenatis]NKE04668.1 AAA family ATPase [Mesobacillus selenatarsenatis]